MQALIGFSLANRFHFFRGDIMTTSDELARAALVTRELLYASANPTERRTNQRIYGSGLSRCSKVSNSCVLRVLQSRISPDGARGISTAAIQHAVRTMLERF